MGLESAHVSESPILPVRGRAVRPSGRHRRPVPSQLPPEAPALVLATLGDASGTTAELAALIRVDNPQIQVRLAGLGEDAKELTSELEAAARERPEDGVAAIVVPLLTGPHPVADRLISMAVAASGVSVTVTDSLGPHPLLAEALHIRLSEKGLARADRMRLLNVSRAPGRRRHPRHRRRRERGGGGTADGRAAGLAADAARAGRLTGQRARRRRRRRATPRHRRRAHRPVPVRPGSRGGPGLASDAAAEIGADCADVLGRTS